MVGHLVSSARVSRVKVGSNVEDLLSNLVPLVDSCSSVSLLPFFLAAPSSSRSTSSSERSVPISSANTLFQPFLPRIVERRTDDFRLSSLLSLFQGNFKNYDAEWTWNDPKAVPMGFGALAAFCAGVIGAWSGMSQVRLRPLLFRLHRRF